MATLIKRGYSLKSGGRKGRQYVIGRFSGYLRFSAIVHSKAWVGSATTYDPEGTALSTWHRERGKMIDR